MHGLAGSMKREKERIYELKAQTLHHLVEDGRVDHAGLHHFGDDRWAEVLRGDGYCFHRPCPPPVSEAIATLSLGLVEAKPKEAAEPTLEVACEVVAQYLAGRPAVAVYEWPRPEPEPVREPFSRGDGMLDDDDEVGPVRRSRARRQPARTWQVVSQLPWPRAAVRGRCRFPQRDAKKQ